MTTRLELLSVHEGGVHLRVWRDGRAEDAPHAVPWPLLKAAAHQDDDECRQHYAPIYDEAVRKLHAQMLFSALRRVRDCDHTRHELGVEVRPYSGAVSPEENRSAHGCACMIDRCECGATRKRNVNFQHEEIGDWNLDIYDQVQRTRAITLDWR